MTERVGYVVLERPAASPLFCGLPWPQLGEHEFAPEEDLQPLAHIPQRYLAEARRLSTASPQRWTIAYYVDVTEGTDGGVLPDGWWWLGFDLGEAVWNAQAGYSIIACECRPGQRLDVWWDALTPHSLVPTMEAASDLLASRASMVARDPEGFESHFGDGVRIYRVAVAEIPPPWREPPGKGDR